MRKKTIRWSPKPDNEILGIRESPLDFKILGPRQLHDGNASQPLWEANGKLVFVEPAETLRINFNNYAIEQYFPQENEGDVEILDGGNTLELTGNVWRAINIGYKRRPESVLAFDFEVLTEGEIQGFGIDTDNNENEPRNELIRKLFGTQTEEVTEIPGYPGSGVFSFWIPIGSQYQFQDWNYLVFVNDDDANKNAKCRFSNVRIFDSASAQTSTRNFFISETGHPDSSSEQYPGVISARVRLNSAIVRLLDKSFRWHSHDSLEVDLMLAVDPHIWNRDGSHGHIHAHFQEAICVGGQIDLDPFHFEHDGDATVRWNEILEGLLQLEPTASPREVSLLPSGLSLLANPMLAWADGMLQNDIPLLLSLPMNAETEVERYLHIRIDEERLFAERFREGREELIGQFDRLEEITRLPNKPGDSNPQWLSLQLNRTSGIPEFHWEKSISDGVPNELEYLFALGAWELGLSDSAIEPRANIRCFPNVKITSMGNGDDKILTLELQRNRNDEDFSLGNIPFDGEENTPMRVPDSLENIISLTTDSIEAIDVEKVEKLLEKDSDARQQAFADLNLLPNNDTPTFRTAVSRVSTALRRQASRLIYSYDIDPETNERIQGEHVPLGYQPTEAAEFLRRLHGLPIPSRNDFDIKITAEDWIDPPVLWGYLKLENGWIELPFLNVTEQVYADLFNPPPRPSIPFVNGAAIFSSAPLQGTPLEQEHLWSVSITDVAGVSGKLIFKPSVEGNDPHFKQAKIDLLRPTMTVEGLVWMGTTPPRREDSLPDMENWMTGLQPLPLRTLDEATSLPSPFQLELNDLTLTPRDEVGEGLGSWSLTIGVNDDPSLVAQRIKTVLNVKPEEPAGVMSWLLAGGPFPEVLLVGDDETLDESNESPFQRDDLPPIIWRRHPDLPVIQSLPLTQGLGSTSHPASSRELIPLDVRLQNYQLLRRTIRESDPVDGDPEDIVLEARDLWLPSSIQIGVAVHDDNDDIVLVEAATSYPTLMAQWSQSSLDDSLSVYSSLSGVFLSLPGWTWQPQESLGVAWQQLWTEESLKREASNGLRVQMRAGVPVLDQTLALISHDATDELSALQETGALASAITGEGRDEIPGRDWYPVLWAELNEKSRFAECSAEYMLGVNSSVLTNELSIENLIEPLNWIAKATGEATYPGRVELADPDDGALKVNLEGIDALRGIHGAFDTQGATELVLSSDGLWEIVAGALQSPITNVDMLGSETLMLRDQRGWSRGFATQPDAKFETVSRPMISHRAADKVYQLHCLIGPLELHAGRAAINTNATWTLSFTDLPFDESNSFDGEALRSRLAEDINDPALAAADRAPLTGYQWSLERADGNEELPLMLADVFPFFPLRCRSAKLDGHMLKEVRIVGRLQLPMFSETLEQAFSEMDRCSNAVILTFVRGSQQESLRLSKIETAFGERLDDDLTRASVPAEIQWPLVFDSGTSAKKRRPKPMLVVMPPGYETSLSTHFVEHLPTSTRETRMSDELHQHLTELGIDVAVGTAISLDQDAGWTFTSSDGSVNFVMRLDSEGLSVSLTSGEQTLLPEHFVDELPRIKTMSDELHQQLVERGIDVASATTIFLESDIGWTFSSSDGSIGYSMRLDSVGLSVFESTSISAGSITYSEDGNGISIVSLRNTLITFSFQNVVWTRSLHDEDNAIDLIASEDTVSISLGEPTLVGTDVLSGSVKEVRLKLRPDDYQFDVFRFSHQVFLEFVARWGDSAQPQVESRTIFPLIEGVMVGGQLDSVNVRSYLKNSIGNSGASWEFEVVDHGQFKHDLMRGVTEFEWQNLLPATEDNGSSLLPEVLPGFEVSIADGDEPTTAEIPKGFAVLSFAIDAVSGKEPIFSPEAGFVEALLPCRWGKELPANERDESIDTATLYKSSSGHVYANVTWTLIKEPGQVTHSWNTVLTLNGLLEITNLISWPVLEIDGDELGFHLPKLTMETERYHHVTRVLLNQHQVPEEIIAGGKETTLFTLVDEKVWRPVAAVEHRIQRVRKDTGNPVFVESRSFCLTSEVRMGTVPAFKSYLDDLGNHSTTDPRDNNQVRPIPDAVSGYQSRQMLEDLLADPLIRGDENTAVLIVDASVHALLRKEPKESAKTVSYAVTQLLPRALQQAQFLDINDFHCDFDGTDAQLNQSPWTLLSLPFLGRLQSHALDSMQQDLESQLHVDPILQLENAGSISDQHRLLLNFTSLSADAVISVRPSVLERQRHRDRLRVDPNTLLEGFIRLQSTHKSAKPGLGGVLLSGKNSGLNRILREETLTTVLNPFRNSFPPKRMADLEVFLNNQPDSFSWHLDTRWIIQDVAYLGDEERNKRTYAVNAGHLSLAMSALSFAVEKTEMLTEDSRDSTIHPAVSILPTIPPSAGEDLALQPVTFAVSACAALRQLVVDEDQLLETPLMTFSELLCLNVNGSQLEVVTTRTWKAEDTPTKDELRAWGKACHARLAIDSPIAIVRVKRLRRAKLVMQGERETELVGQVGFDFEFIPLPELVQTPRLAGESTAQSSPAILRRYAEPQLREHHHLSQHIVERVGPQPGIVQPLYLRTRPSVTMDDSLSPDDPSQPSDQREWPNGLSALHFDVRITNNGVCPVGTLIGYSSSDDDESSNDVVDARIWWNSDQVNTQYSVNDDNQVSSRRLPSQFRAAPIGGFLPWMTTPSLPAIDPQYLTPEKDAFYPSLNAYWQSWLSGRFRRLVQGARPGAPMLFQHRIVLSESDMIASSGSTAIQHRIPRPMHLPANQPLDPNALQTIGTSFALHERPRRLMSMPDWVAVFTDAGRIHGVKHAIRDFDTLDDNSDGELTSSEVTPVLWSLISDADTTSDGNVSLSELNTYLDLIEFHSDVVLIETVQLAISEFDDFDTDSNGQVSSTDVTPEIWEQIRSADTNSDNSVTLDDLNSFLDRMVSLHPHTMILSLLPHPERVVTIEVETVDDSTWILRIEMHTPDESSTYLVSHDAEEGMVSFDPELVPTLNDWPSKLEHKSLRPLVNQHPNGEAILDLLDNAHNDAEKYSLASVLISTVDGLKGFLERIRTDTSVEALRNAVDALLPKIDAALATTIPQEKRNAFLALRLDLEAVQDLADVDALASQVSQFVRLLANEPADTFGSKEPWQEPANPFVAVRHPSHDWLANIEFANHHLVFFSSALDHSVIVGRGPALLDVTLASKDSFFVDTGQPLGFEIQLNTPEFTEQSVEGPQEHKIRVLIEYHGITEEQVVWDNVRLVSLADGRSFEGTIDPEQRTLLFPNPSALQLQQWIQLAPAGAPLVLQAAVSLEPLAQREYRIEIQGFRQQLNLPLRLKRTGARHSPHEPRFQLFEDPEYNRSLGTKPVRTAIPVPFRLVANGNQQLFGLTIAADRAEFTATERMLLCWYIDTTLFLLDVLPDSFQENFSPQLVRDLFEAAGYPRSDHLSDPMPNDPTANRWTVVDEHPTHPESGRKFEIRMKQDAVAVVAVLPEPDTTIGTITTDLATASNTFTVQQSVIDNIQVGDNVKLSDDTNTNDCGQVFSINSSASTIVVTTATANSFAAATPTYVRVSTKNYKAKMKIELVRPSGAAVILFEESAFAWDPDHLREIDLTGRAILQDGVVVADMRNDVQISSGDALNVSATIEVDRAPDRQAHSTLCRLNVVGRATLPPPSSAYGLFYSGTDDQSKALPGKGGVSVPRFAWSPEPVRIELINPDDLKASIVRRRAVFQWSHTIRSGESARYAVQKTTSIGETHIPAVEEELPR